MPGGQASRVQPRRRAPSPSFKTRRLTVDLDVGLYQALRVKCAINDVTISDVTRGLVETTPTRVTSRRLRFALQRSLDPHEPFIPDPLADHPGKRRHQLQRTYRIGFESHG